MIHLGKEKSTTSAFTSLPLQQSRLGLRKHPGPLLSTHPRRVVAHEGHRGSAGGGVERGDKVGEGSESGPADRAAQSQVSSGRVTSPIFKYNLSIPFSSSFLNSGKRHIT